MKRLWLFIGLLLVPTLYAQNKDQQTYCAYIESQAQSQALLDKYPNLSGGAIQPSTGTPPQMYVGLSESLSGLRKASALKQQSSSDCQLYIAEGTAQIQIQYVPVLLDRENLQDRLHQIDHAIEQLDNTYVQLDSIVRAQNATEFNLYTIQAAKSKLLMDRQVIYVQFSSLSTPDLSNLPIKVLITRKLESETNKALAVEKLERLDNWDILLEGGVRQQLKPFQTGRPGQYVTATFKWNIGSKKRERIIESTSINYELWKTNQQNDVVQQAILLHDRLQASLSANEIQLAQLKQEYQHIDSKFVSMNELDTKEAITFTTQLKVDAISMNIEISSCAFRIAQLKQFLQDNF